jgi:hypothetical protein
MWIAPVREAAARERRATRQRPKWPESDDEQRNGWALECAAARQCTAGCRGSVGPRARHAEDMHILQFLHVLDELKVEFLFHSFAE